jgi:PEP-CTERM motif
VVHYLIPDESGASATFNIVPIPPPSPPVVQSISARFDFDAETMTQSNVVISTYGSEWGPLGIDTYLQFAPMVLTTPKSIIAFSIDDNQIENQMEIGFADPLDGSQPVNDIRFVFIMAASTCGRPPHGCLSSKVQGEAQVALRSTAIPEPASFAMLGASIALLGIMRRTKRRRLT